MSRDERENSWWNELLEDSDLKSIWEHIEELGVRLRRIFIAIGVAALLSAAIPLEALQPLFAVMHVPLPQPLPMLHHNENIPGNMTLESLITSSQLACNVTRVAIKNDTATVVLRCLAESLHNSTGMSNRGGEEGVGLGPIHLGAGVKWTPLIVKLPELLVSLVVPRYVYARGQKYPVYVMPVDTWEAFQIIIYSALLLGVLLASPIIVREIWAYVEPALYPHEKRLVKRYSLAFLGLFLAGVFIALFLIAPLAYRVTLMLYPYFVPSGYTVLIRVSIAEVLSFIVELCLATGVVFEIPVILYILIVNEVLAYETVKSNLKYVLLATLVIGALLSPDPSGVGMLIIAFTLYTPIHIATWLAGRALKKKSRGGSS